MKQLEKNQELYRIRSKTLDQSIELNGNQKETSPINILRQSSFGPLPSIEKTSRKMPKDESIKSEGFKMPYLDISPEKDSPSKLKKLKGMGPKSKSVQKIVMPKQTLAPMKKISIRTIMLMK